MLVGPPGRAHEQHRTEGPARRDAGWPFCYPIQPEMCTAVCSSGDVADVSSVLGSSCPPQARETRGASRSQEERKGAMPRDGTTNKLGIPWWQLALDSEWLAWWYTYGPPSEDQYPTEFADAMQDERGRKEQQRDRDASSARSPAFAGLRGLFQGFASRLRGFRPQMAGPARSGQEIAIAAKRS